MMKALFVLLFCLSIFFQAEGQIPYLHLSPMQKLEQRVAMTDITIEYSRPHMRGRKIFGDLVPYDSLWRTGANRNSKITFSKPVVINKMKVNAGTYAIITRPGETQWEVYLYSDLTHWEVPSPWDEKLIVAQAIVPSEKTERITQRMTFSIGDFTDDECTLELFWENTRIEIPIGITTNASIREVLKGPSADDYYRASLYALTSNKDLEDGLKWAQLAIDTRAKKEYFDQHVKAQILAKFGRYEEALLAAKAGLVLAKARPSEYGEKEAKKLIAAYEAALKM